LKTRLAILAAAVTACVGAPAALAAEPPPGSYKNVEFLANVPDLNNTISLNFIRWNEDKEVMFVSGRYGLKSYDVSDPANPVLLDTLASAELNPGAPGTLWENEDMDVDPNRKLVFLSRDPRAYGGNTNTGESGIYIIDASRPRSLSVMSYIQVPAGHTTTCINKCRFLWTGGPAKATSQPADWGGRPVWVTDVSRPKTPVLYPNPIDTGRNDGKTDYSHDVQVDSDGIAWVSGRGGVRGYYTDGIHYDPLLQITRKATAWDPIPYAGGKFEEAFVRSSFMHNSWRPTGTTADDGADTSQWAGGSLIYATEEDFRGGCGDGVFAISELQGSFGGEGWLSTPAAPFRLKTVGTWTVNGKEGNSTSGDCSAHYFQMQDGIVAYAFYSQGTRFLDVSDPTNIQQVGYFRPNGGTAWAPYFHNGLVYIADNRRGVDIVRPLATAGVTAKVAEPAALSADEAWVPVVDPYAEESEAESLRLLCNIL
jgi:hypothetical protein